MRPKAMKKIISLILMFALAACSTLDANHSAKSKPEPIAIGNSATKMSDKQSNGGDNRPEKNVKNDTNKESTNSNKVIANLKDTAIWTVAIPSLIVGYFVICPFLIFKKGDGFC